jgi:hypothetical protein
MPSLRDSEIKTLQANLYLLATDMSVLRTYLTGYTDFGIYQECIHAVRGEMAEFGNYLLEGLNPGIAAAIFDCFYLMESLSRYPAQTNNEISFEHAAEWKEVRLKAKTAADLIETLE